MDREPTDIGFELLKYILLFGSLPLWAPFAKALWDEFLLALRADGGLSGHEPTRHERAAIEAKLAATEEFSQVHEPIANVRTGPTGPPSTGRTTQPVGSKVPARTSGPQVGGQRRPFSGAPGQPSSHGNRPRFR